MRLKILICVLLAGITLAIYWPARHFDFVYYDDEFFMDNPEITAGVNWHSIKWATTAVVVSNWHPVTVFSFMVTHQFFGRNPGAEHLVNMGFHAASAVLLFLVLVRMTDATWRSAIVAGLFAWHPLRVESVAWIAERKDVLFVFFMLLSLLCYAAYARPAAPNALEKEEGGFGKQARRRSGVAYAGSLLFFILAFMSKAMVVTLPFLLLLLDFWPLGRFQGLFGGQRTDRPTLKKLLIEKIPFFALTVFFSGLTFCIQNKHKAVASVNELDIVSRFDNVTSSYVHYLGHFFWPINLAVTYPYPSSFDWVQVLLAALLLLAVTALCVLEIPRRPYLAVGWFWYLGTMIPVIGLVQIGIDAMADRYTYLPLIGPVISVAWLVSEWARPSLIRNFLIVMTIVILVACAMVTRWQLMFWQNSVTLFNRDIAVAPENILPHVPLALGLEEQKRWREAATQFEVSLARTPTQSRIMLHPTETYDMIVDLHFANVLGQLGCEKRADESLEAALTIKPDTLQVLNNLAWSLATSRDANVRNGKRAVELAEHACELTHDRVTIFIGTLAAAYAEAGRFDDAMATAQKTIALAKQRGETTLVQKNEELLQLYRAHEAYHQEGP
jgi:tetratricopeptide (TPR) repeat protein